MRQYSYATLLVLLSGNPLSAQSTQSTVSTAHGYSFLLTDDSSHATGTNQTGYRLWVRTTPAFTRVQFGENEGTHAAQYAIVDAQTRVGYMQAKENILEGSIDALSGPFGALAWPPDHPDQYTQIVVRDETVPGTDSVLGRAATHRRFLLTYDQYEYHQRERADCWYVDVPATLRDGINHATHVFGATDVEPRNRLNTAIWSVPLLAPVRCAFEQTLDGGRQYGVRTSHETWIVSDIAPRDFDPAFFRIPSLPHIKSPYRPGTSRP